MRRVQVGSAGTHTTLGTITATWDADGQIASQTVPMATGTLTAAWTRTSTGQAEQLDWLRSGLALPWMTSSTTVDAHGRVATDTSSLYAVGGRVREYSYDPAGRLTSVADTREGACTTRAYGFDVNGNRTSSAAYAPAAGGACQTSTPSSTTATAYTAADQPTGTGLAYDALGRTTSLPAAHTATPAAGPVTLSYYASDLLRSTATGSQVSAWTLDTGDRLACRRDRPVATADVSVCGATVTSGVTDTVNHYAGSSDSPAWTQTRTGGATPVTSTTSYLPGLDGAMLASVTGGTVVVALSDLHGDTPLTSTTAQAVAPDGATTDTDEYGQARDATGAPTTGPRYAWLGTAQRDATAGGGLTLMGVRVYNPATGRFLTTDPVRGGNTTTYGYPTDPVNRFDSSGKCWSWVPTFVCDQWDSFNGEAWACAMSGATRCVAAIAISKFVERCAAKTYEETDPRRNSARHFVWQMMLMWRIGLTGAKIWATGHEIGSAGLDTAVDWHNNRAAWSYGWRVMALPSWAAAWWYTMRRLKLAFASGWLMCLGKLRARDFAFTC